MPDSFECISNDHLHAFPSKVTLASMHDKLIRKKPLTLSADFHLWLLYLHFLSIVPAVTAVGHCRVVGCSCQARAQEHVRHEQFPLFWNQRNGNYKVVGRIVLGTISRIGVLYRSVSYAVYVFFFFESLLFSHIIAVWRFFFCIWSQPFFLGGGYKDLRNHSKCREM